ncbi:mechanosensitive ion channel domain-containing protein [uncultured Marinobacter sp.]|uniref:mechanosensitive ion channel domain-containing protein n=1 Tax=uncultured Marinobacter sp. TaxID=187379 RepID=UPI00338DF02B
MSTSKEVQDLIAELTRLQLQQTEVIARLTRLTEAEPKQTRTVSPTRPTPTDTIRDFAIGDRVRITNPRPFQTATGSIKRIGTHRITVRTASGNNIIRAPKNLVHL